MVRKMWLALLVAACAVAGAKEPIQEIECVLTPIHSSKIHPRSDDLEYAAISGNWAGYIAVGNQCTFVGGVWSVPRLVKTADDSGNYVAVWVGIDGFMNRNVEQIGTTHYWSNSGVQQNFAWVMLYPQGGYEIENFPLDIGDLLTGKVAYVGNDTFRMTLVNHTKNIKTTIPYSKTKFVGAERNSAEWIVEAPKTTFLRYSPLANFKPITMKYCSATFDGVSGPINSTAWLHTPMHMISNTYTKALPSELTSQGTGFSAFTVRWLHE